MIRVVVAILFAALATAPQPPAHPLEREPFAPRHLVCYRASSALAIDGHLEELAWQTAPWSDTFVDIEGAARPAPRLRTRMKMLWDDEYLYVAADMEEPDLWGTFTRRESIIFHENDFEVFIDPDGDTHDYYELEINGLNTVWDLMLTRPYRDGGKAINAWDIAGLKTAVYVRGTFNRPGDKDEGWSVEIAMPWEVLKEATPEVRKPRAGEQWRVNFSRVQWPLDVRDGKYVKRTDAKGNLIAENNWVWSPQGAVAMHMPERWGYVQFSDTPSGRAIDRFVPAADEAARWTLRRLYYRQADFRKAHGRYARTLAELAPAGVPLEGIQLHATDHLYVLSTAAASGTLYLRQDGRVWAEPARASR